MAKIRVLIVDDSALVRQVLTELLSQAPDIEVVGAAADPYVARDKIKQLNPDVLTLDVEMPRMDGVTFLGNLMRLRPMPVVMVSTLTEQGAEVTLRALEFGAVDFVAKPKLDVAEGLKDYAAEIIEKVRAASKAHVKAIDRRPRKTADGSAEKHSADVILKAGGAKRHFRTTDRIIGIGSSTGVPRP
jgi:two-component system chemotaxis response regulator CheB